MVGIINVTREGSQRESSEMVTEGRRKGNRDGVLGFRLRNLPFVWRLFSMRSLLFVSFLLAGMAFGQAIPAPQTAPTKEEPGETEAASKPAAPVSPDAPVITIKGLCDADKAGKPECQTVVSKAEFEKLASTLEVPEARKRQLAEAYGRLLYLSHEAEKRGLDKGPRFEESMRFRRMQALAEQLSKNLVDEANKIPDSDVEKFYNTNPEAFQEAELLRVFVPKMKTTVPVKDAKAPTEAEQKANEAGMKKEADALHTRAVAGEDFDALQKAAFTAGGLKATPPSAKLGKIRRTGLPPEHAQVFDLKPGEVSAVIPDTGGYFIYKLISKQQAPLASVKEEIHNTLLGQKMKDAQAEFQSASTPVLSEAYFGPAQTAPKPPSMARPEAPKKPQPK